MDNQHTAIDSVLVRLDRNIREIGRRLLENEDHIGASVLINSSLRNLQRIQEGISPECYEAINGPLQQLASLCPSADHPDHEFASGDASQDGVVSHEASGFHAERVLNTSGNCY